MKPQDYENKMLPPAPANKQIPVQSSGYVHIDRDLEQAEIDELKRIVAAYDGTIPLEQHIHEYPSQYDFSKVKHVTIRQEETK